MGIQDLNKVIKKADPSVFKTCPITDFSGKRVAVDISIYINAFAMSSQEFWVNLMTQFLVELVKNNLNPIIVFDGPNVPKEKLDERESRKHGAEKNKEREAKLAHLKDRILMTCFEGSEPKIVPDEIQADFKKTCRNWEKEGINIRDAEDVLLFVNKRLNSAEQAAAGITKHHKDTTRELVRSLGLQHIQSDGEAETLCASLAYHGMVDAVVSRDGDCLVYGSPILITEIKKGQASYVVYKEILAAMEMTRKQFTDLCISLKCDYNVRMPKQGAVACTKAIKQYGSIEEWRKAKPELPFHQLKWKRCRELFRPYSLNYINTKCSITVRPQSVEKLDKIYGDANSRYTGQFVLDSLVGKATFVFKDNGANFLGDVEEE